MADRVQPGVVVDGFRVGECIHRGGNGAIYQVDAPAAADPGFPLVMKVPRLGRGEATLGIESFEMEQMILPTLRGSHVPRFVATGDMTATPYIVMERIDGVPLADTIGGAPLPPEAVAQIGAAIADAIHSIHAQEVIHLDLKPENVLLRPSGEAVLLDFGFARHARYPDLLGEELHFAAGSAAYVSPEQLQDDRSDPRSDLYALGVLLYELATGSQPFGQPESLAGMRDRLWREPAPPRAVNAKVPPWLQEVILHCLEHDASLRYQSAAHVALDLRHPEQVVLVDPGETDRALGLRLASEAMVARAARNRSPLAVGATQRGARGRDPGRRRYRASGRRAPLAVAMDDPTDCLAQSGVSVDVRVGDPQPTGGRGHDRPRDRDGQAPRAQNAVAALGRAAEAPVVARFAPRRRSPERRRYASRPRACQPR